MRATEIHQRVSKRESGMTTTEYAVAGGLLAAAIVLAFTDLGAAIAAAISFLASVLQL